MDHSFTRRDIEGVRIYERRASPRTPLLFPAKLVCVYDSFDCMVLDLSEVGAFIKTTRPLSVDASAYLRAGPFNIFAIGVRKVFYSHAYALSGVVFDERLTPDQIKHLHRYAREWAQSEERREYQAARRSWHPAI